jgi:isopentenyl diphosphate isomerase/L-lactate dehydrogenase-like FMN-dependent dehydrogenase
MTTPRSRPPRLVSWRDVRAAAERRLPRPLFDYVEGGAEDEVTMRANEAAFRSLGFRPRMAVWNPRPELATTVVGTSIAVPILTAPCGGMRLVHPDGDIAVASAAARQGTIAVVPSSSCFTLEEIACRSAPGPRWFQLYRFMSEQTMYGLVERAAAAGYEALVITVDTVVAGHREKDLRNGFSYNLRPDAHTAVRLARQLGVRPRWLYGYLRDGMPFQLANTVGSGYTSSSSRLTDMGRTSAESQSPTWRDIRKIRDMWPRPLVIKGILSPEDARIAADCGADALIVSNHGGRQLEGAPATMRALPEIVAAVGDRAEILLDSGVRRGNDVLKALALGARAVLAGRNVVHGLAVAGADGVGWALDLLRTDMLRSMRLMGLPSVTAIDRSWVTNLDGSCHFSQPPSF